MNKADAIRRVQKLEALADPRRGGTEAECKAARRKADKLIASHGLHKADTRPRTPRPKKRTFTGATAGPSEAWSFNPATGEHSPNVKVEHYRNAGNWKIEIPL